MANFGQVYDYFWAVLRELLGIFEKFWDIFLNFRAFCFRTFGHFLDNFRAFLRELLHSFWRTFGHFLENFWALLRNLWSFLENF